MKKLFAVIAVALVAIPAAGARTHRTSYTCTIRGTAGDDALLGTEGRDVMCGFGGNDTLMGMGGNDVLLGGPGNDMLDGGGGDDVILGGTGNDTINAWEGAPDYVDGGPGRDRGWFDRTLDRVRNVESR